MDDAQRGAVLVSRADLAYSRRDFEQSQLQLEEAIKVWERAFGPQDLNLVGPLNGLANVFIKIGDPANAIRCLQRAQSILEKNPNPVFLAHILVNFSTAQVMAGNTVAAESLLKKALEIASSTLGDDSPLAGEILANYAAVARKMGRKSESKQLAKRARQIRQATRSAGSALSTIDVGQLAREKR